MTEHIHRYKKQIRLPEVGISGQEKLGNAKVLVIGAGGLGCPVLNYLAAAGIGTLGIMDFDLVEENNLQRQPLYGMSDIGNPKADSAKKRLEMLNPYLNYIAFPEKMTPANALGILNDFDIIADCTDNYAARYLLNDACLILGKPWVFASIQGWEGQVSVFNYIDKSGEEGPSYRCIYPEPPPAEERLSCNEGGIIGSIASVIGSIQANEILKCLLQSGEVLSGKLAIYNLLNHQNTIISFGKNPNVIPPISLDPTLYESYCEPMLISGEEDLEIAVRQLVNYPEMHFNLIDIREEFVYEEDNSGAVNIPYEVLIGQPAYFKESAEYVLLCDEGRKSKALVQFLRDKFGIVNIKSLSGGWNELKKFQAIRQ